MGAALANTRGNDYMPLKLKAVLARHGIAQTELAENVLQSTGRPMSSAAVSLLINHGYWPKSTTVVNVRKQVEDFLVIRQIEGDELATIWQLAEGADAQRHQQPAGSHLRALDAHSPYKARNTVPKSNDPLFEPMEVEMLNPAAKRHFKIFRDPFQDDVNGPEDVFLAEDQRYIREAMFQTSKHGGFLAVIGESGAGKSVLRRDLIDRIRRDGHPISVIFPCTLDKTKLTASNICEAIIGDLQPGMKVKISLEAKARQVAHVLKSSAQSGNAHVLMIEEAHDISVATLKYLKRFWELEDGFKKLLSIILVGQPELKMKLDERTNWEAREVIRRCEIAELLPLNGNLRGYLVHKLARINIPVEQVFAEDAFDAIRARLTRTNPGSREVMSKLYPLVVNNLVTKAMNRAAELGLPTISGDLVKEL